MNRIGAAVALCALAATAVSCLSRGVEVVPFLPPTATATLPELLETINRWRLVESLVLRADLQFETVEEAEEGRGRQYRTAQGRLLLERPSHIRLNIEAPILSADIAEMASDGERFQLLIHPADYRALIVGSNRERYEAQVEKLEKDPELEKAGPLVNIRPQHFTEAFLLTPVGGDRQTVAFLHEEFAIEPDVRPGADDDARVRKSYYVVTAGELGDSAAHRRYWFDRSGETALVRQQIYGEEGELVADIEYLDLFPPDPETGVRIPARVHIDRPLEDYGIALTVNPDGIQINRDLPDTAFEISPPETWGDTLRRIDLDERAPPGGP